MNLLPIRGVRVEGDKVIIAVKGGNTAARKLCGDLVAAMERQVRDAQPSPELVAKIIEA